MKTRENRLLERACSSGALLFVLGLAFSELSSLCEPWDTSS